VSAMLGMWLSRGIEREWKGEGGEEGEEVEK
jgi:hypothetical protein